MHDEDFCDPIVEAGFEDTDFEHPGEDVEERWRDEMLDQQEREAFEHADEYYTGWDDPFGGSFGDCDF